MELPVEPNDYPVLNYYGIPLNDESVVQKVLRDFTTFQNNNKSFDLFTFPVYNNKPTIAAAQCTTYLLNKRIAKVLNKTPRTENKEALDENQPTITTNLDVSLKCCERLLALCSFYKYSGKHCPRGATNKRSWLNPKNCCEPGRGD